jgi:hypothetical protein
MNTTTTIPAVEVSVDPVMSGDVFYGSFDTTVKGKKTSVIVSNHIKDTSKKYNFRAVTKCQAGFPSISDFKNHTPHGVIAGFKKNTLLNVQVEVFYENGQSNWYNVYTTKNGKWYSIDLGFLEVLTVGDMRNSFPDMCDMNLWELVGAKTWADKAFTQN